MPETLTQSDINSKTDPSVAKQYDDETPKDKQIQEFFKLVDSKKVCMLNTYRNGVGAYCPYILTSHFSTNNNRPSRSLHGNRETHWP